MRSVFSTNYLLALLFPWYHALLVTQVAGEVARQCRASLSQRVVPRTAGMSIAEIRGYVRAHAAGCVRNEVERTGHRRCLRSAVEKRVVDAAVDQLVVMVARDVFCGEPSAATRTMAA